MARGARLSRSPRLALPALLGRLALAALLGATWGCAADPPPPGSLVDQGQGTTDAGPCEAIEVQAARAAPEVLVLLDRSGSMYGPPTTDRWTPAVSAILNLVDTHQGAVAFGLGLFGDRLSCGAGTIVVPPSGTSASRIQTALTGDPSLLTGGGTPTSAMLTRARTFYALSEGERYVVLVTDGAPNCNAVQGERTSCFCTLDDCESVASPWLGCLDDLASVAAVEALAADGIPTWVIGYDTPAFSDTLDAMARAGATGSDAYIPVADQTTLSDALDGIAAELVSCSYTLSSAPGDPSYVRVVLDGTPIPHPTQLGTAAGDSGVSEVGTFVLEEGNRVRLVGPACDALQDGGTHQLAITRECEPVIFG